MSDELSLMLKECEERPWGSTRNSRVSILIRHHLDLLKELDLLSEKVNRLHKIMDQLEAPRPRGIMSDKAYPAWEIWSDDDSWGMRELDTRMLRKGASIEEASSNKVHHINMGCLPEKSGTNDCQFMGQFIKEWAWRVAVPQLLEENRDLLKEIARIHQAVREMDPDLRVARLLVDESSTHCGMGCGMCKARGDALIEALNEIDRIHQAVRDEARDGI